MLGPRSSRGRSHFVGMITPSGNTVVERVTIGMLRDFPEVSCHFSRTPVHGAVDPFPADYDWDSMLGAARLLAHAKPEIIAWSGSKAGSIAFDLDRELCRRIAAETGCRATTSTIALIDALARLGTNRVGADFTLFAGLPGESHRNIRARGPRLRGGCLRGP